MFIKLTQDYGNHKKDAVIQEPDGIARAYIDAGIAVESTADEQLRSFIATEIAKSQAKVDEALRGLKDEFKSTPPGVDAKTIEAGTASADRGKKGFGDILRNISKALSVNADPEARMHAHERLTRSYGLTKSNFSDPTGDRIADPEGIARTGTESISGGSTYGYLVKPEWVNSLFSIAMEDSVVEDGAFNIPVGRALEVNWPALDQFRTPTAGMSASVAGVQVYRLGEVTQRIASDANISQINFKTTDLTGFTYLSRDLIEDDYISSEGVIQKVFAMAFSWKKDWEYLNGTGVGQPLGITKSPALLTASRGTSNHIEYEDLVSMQTKLYAPCWKNARWLTNVTTVVDLQAIKNHAGSYVYQPNAMISQSMTPGVRESLVINGDRYRAGGMLLGWPVYLTEKLPVLGSANDLMLIDPTQYGIATRAGLEVGISDQFAFDTDRIAFRFKLRNDAKPLWRSTYKQADGSNTQVSPFVTLAA